SDIRRGGSLMLGATVLVSGAGLSVNAIAAPLNPADDVPAATSPDGTVSFSIAPGSMNDVIAAFAKTAKLKVTLDDPAYGAIQSSGVSGLFTPQDAMARLLVGTSLKATFGADGVVVKLRDVSETVEVTGSALAPSSPKYTQSLLDTPQTLTIIPRTV